jgi:hypothetical protein
MKYGLLLPDQGSGRPMGDLLPTTHAEKGET